MNSMMKKKLRNFYGLLFFVLVASISHVQAMKPEQYTDIDAIDKAIVVAKRKGQAALVNRFEVRKAQLAEQQRERVREIAPALQQQVETLTKQVEKQRETVERAQEIVRHGGGMVGPTLDIEGAKRFFAQAYVQFESIRGDVEYRPALLGIIGIEQQTLALHAFLTTGDPEDTRDVREKIENIKSYAPVFWQQLQGDLGIAEEARSDEAPSEALVPFGSRAVITPHMITPEYSQTVAQRMTFLFSLFALLGLDEIRSFSNAFSRGLEIAVEVLNRQFTEGRSDPSFNLDNFALRASLLQVIGINLRQYIPREHAAIVDNIERLNEVVWEALQSKRKQEEVAAERRSELKRSAAAAEVVEPLGRAERAFLAQFEKRVMAEFGTSLDQVKLLPPAVLASLPPQVKELLSKLRIPIPEGGAGETASSSGGRAAGLPITFIPDELVCEGLTRFYIEQSDELIKLKEAEEASIKSSVAKAEQKNPLDALQVRVDELQQQLLDDVTAKCHAVVEAGDEAEKIYKYIKGLARQTKVAKDRGLNPRDVLLRGLDDPKFGLSVPTKAILSHPPTPQIITALARGGTVSTASSSSIASGGGFLAGASLRKTPTVPAKKFATVTVVADALKVLPIVLSAMPFKPDAKSQPFLETVGVDTKIKAKDLEKVCAAEEIGVKHTPAFFDLVNIILSAFDKVIGQNPVLFAAESEAIVNAQPPVATIDAIIKDMKSECADRTGFEDVIRSGQLFPNLHRTILLLLSHYGQFYSALSRVKSPSGFDAVFSDGLKREMFNQWDAQFAVIDQVAVRDAAQALLMMLLKIAVHPRIFTSKMLSGVYPSPLTGSGYSLVFILEKFLHRDENIPDAELEVQIVEQNLIVKGVAIAKPLITKICGMLRVFKRALNADRDYQFNELTRGNFRTHEDLMQALRRIHASGYKNDAAVVAVIDALNRGFDLTVDEAAFDLMLEPLRPILGGSFAAIAEQLATFKKLQVKNRATFERIDTLKAQLKPHLFTPALDDLTVIVDSGGLQTLSPMDFARITDRFLHESPLKAPLDQLKVELEASRALEDKAAFRRNSSLFRRAVHQLTIDQTQWSLPRILQRCYGNVRPVDVEAFADLFTNVHGRIFTMEPRASEIVAALRDTFNLSPAEKSKMELVVGDRLATFVKMIYAIEEKKEDKEFKDNLVRFLTQSCEQFSLQYSPYDQAWEKIRGYLRHGEHRRALLWLFFLLQNIRPEVLLHPSDILLLSKKAPLHHFAFASGADFLGNRTQMVNGLIDERERRAHIKDFADVARNERIARNYKVVFDSAFIPDYFASLQKYGTVSAWRVMRDLSIKARQAFIMIDFAFAKSALQSSRELVDEMRNLSVLGDSVMASNGARDMLRSLYLGIEQGNILRPLKDFLHDASKFTFDGHALTWDTHLVNLPDFEKLVGDAKTAIDRLVDSLHIPEITMDGTTSTAVIFSERLAKLSFARAFDEMLMRIRPIVGVDYTFTPEYVLADMIDEVAAVYPSIRAAFVAVPRRAALPPPPPPPPAYHGLGLDPDFVKKIDLLDILPADKEILGRILAATKGPDYLKGFKLRGFFKNIRNNEKKDLAAQAAAMQTLKDDNPDI